MGVEASGWEGATTSAPFLAKAKAMARPSLLPLPGRIAILCSSCIVPISFSGYRNSQLCQFLLGSFDPSVGTAFLKDFDGFVQMLTGS